MAIENVLQRASFSDARVFLVRPSDERLAQVWSREQAGFEQSDDGPTYIVIGEHAPLERLERLAMRYPQFTIDQLKQLQNVD
ncbi:hypothetical protein [Diaphorobacter sp.]|uniref:hypothetical protein n=1 Tax=Diaphorobacter sp. TaxID=1934310 RepID=UPI0028AE0397|nr:hypothetical protein [Diaphorobacter sp.]